VPLFGERRIKRRRVKGIAGESGGEKRRRNEMEGKKRERWRESGE